MIGLLKNLQIFAKIRKFQQNFANFIILRKSDKILTFLVWTFFGAVQKVEIWSGAKVSFFFPPWLLIMILVGSDYEYPEFPGQFFSANFVSADFFFVRRKLLGGRRSDGVRRTAVGTDGLPDGRPTAV